MKMLPAIKRSDTFSFMLSLKDTNGNALSGVSSFLKAEIRTGKDELIDALVVTETDTPGDYLFKANDTTNWPVGVYLYTDVQYTAGEITSSSETIRILVEKDVTRC